MKNIQFLTNISRRVAMMANTLSILKEAGEISQESRCHWIDDETAWTPEWKARIEASSIVYIRWMGSAIDTPFLKSIIKFMNEHKKVFYVDAAGSVEGEVSAFLDEETLKMINSYANLGGEENYLNLWRYLNHYDEAGHTVEGPKPLLWAGIFHPDEEKPYDTIEAYMADHIDPEKATIGLLFYRDEWVWKDLAYQTALIREIEGQGMNAIAVFSNGIPDEELGIPPLIDVFKKFFMKDGVPTIDTLLNIIKFSVTSTRSLTVPFLKGWNVPMLQAYTLLTNHENWFDNFEGMSPMEVSISVSLPEFDGILHTLPVSTKEDLGNGEYSYVPIIERIPHVVNKARKWAQLKRKENGEKKIAIIFHNYPPSNANIGSAVGLDTIESVRRIMEALQARGYVVSEVPQDGKEFIKTLTANATNDRSMLTEEQIEESNKIKGDDYKGYFDVTHEKVQTQMTKDWGKAPGEVMEYDGSLLVPGTMYGNIFVTVQPPRGYGEDPDKIYHSPFCAPTHQYVAFYQWIRDIWKADAVAHIGTHGSLEWLPGKNAGMGPHCYPDVSQLDLPNVYPYLITITGEGIQAKRRSSACLIEHLPAPQTHAGLYDEMDELEKVMDEYIHFERTQPDKLDALEELVREKVAAANLEGEVAYDDSKPFSDFIGRLHNYLTDLKNLEVHTGLHILGCHPNPEQMIEYIILITRMDNGANPSLYEVLAKTFGGTYDEFLTNSSNIYEPMNITYGMVVDRIMDRGRELVGKLQDAGYPTDDDARKAIVDSLSWLQEDVLIGVLEEAHKAGLVITKEDSKSSQVTSMAMEEGLKELAEANLRPFEEEAQTIRKVVDQLSRFICVDIARNLYLTTQELDNMLCAFEGGYVEPGPSGAPSSGGADLLPTGRNFYGVDPRTLPTQAAWEIGKTLGDQVIERFILEEGHYPEGVGIVLWSGANMRSHGQCVAQFLYLMGIKPKWQAGSMRVTGLEIMPLEELGRPRIDVTGRISGLFRDALPNLAELLDQAVLKVAALDEPLDMNFVKKHIVEDVAELEAEGVAHDDAWRQASFRVFGCPPGAYGAGVSKLLEEKNWDTIDDIADVYVRWGAHAYGGTTRGDFVPKLFRKRMNTIDITIKNEDNHETNMLSSDDYNAYHGGMIATVRSIRGKAPRSYCGDSTNKKKVGLHSLQEETKRLFRSEAINPKFIEGMMKHGYKGAMDMSKYVAHSYQWDATSAVMEDWMYEKYAEKYAFDKDVQEWMKDVNPWALKSIVSTLLEAQQRGLWDAKEETLDELRSLYLDVEGDIEEQADEVNRQKKKVATVRYDTFDEAF